MKYVLLIYHAPGAFDALPQEERDALSSEFDAFNQELTASGEFVGGAALADAPNAKTVRVRDGVPATTDGPFAEAKEQFAGYVSVDVASEERAIEIAASWPGVDRWALEVRAVLGSADDAG